MDIEKKLNVSEYLRLYGSLLTKHQYEMLRLYYDCDISLFEIAEQFNISRQAVRDAIVRGEKALFDFENKLHIKQNNDNLHEYLCEIADLISNNQIDCAYERLQFLIGKTEE